MSRTLPSAGLSPCFCSASLADGTLGSRPAAEALPWPSWGTTVSDMAAANATMEIPTVMRAAWVFMALLPVRCFRRESLRLVSDRHDERGRFDAGVDARGDDDEPCGEQHGAAEGRDLLGVRAHV